MDGRSKNRIRLHPGGFMNTLKTIFPKNVCAEPPEGVLQ